MGTDGAGRDVILREAKCKPRGEGKWCLRRGRQNARVLQSQHEEQTKLTENREGAWSRDMGLTKLTESRDLGQDSLRRGKGLLHQDNEQFKKCKTLRFIFCQLSSRLRGA